MKKYLKSLVFFFSLNTIALAIPSGFFIGSNIGLDLNLHNRNIEANAKFVENKNALWTMYFNPTYGARLGFIIAANDYNAFKITGTYDYTHFSNIAFMQAGASLDYLVSFSGKPNAGGFFIGGGYDFGFYNFAKTIDTYQNTHKHQPYMQLGFFKALGASGKTMMQFGLKHPFGYYYKGVGSDTTVITERASKLFSLYFTLNYTF